MGDDNSGVSGDLPRGSIGLDDVAWEWTFRHPTRVIDVIASESVQDVRLEF